jgi:hypothetical protein
MALTLRPVWMIVLLVASLGGCGEAYDCNCAAHMKIPNRWNGLLEKGTVLARAQLDYLAFTSNVKVNGSSSMLENQVRSYLRVSSFPIFCAGRELSIEFTFVVDREAVKDYSIQKVRFESPNHFIIARPARPSHVLIRP